MRIVRRFWRLFRMLLAIFTHVPYANVAVRFRPEEARPAFRAHRQMMGTRALCRILGVRVTMETQPPNSQAMLYVCNHLGMLDPLVLASQMPVSFAGKAEMGSWPIIGWTCKTMGMLLVERERPSKTSAFVLEVQEKMVAGVSMLVFPEGTTSVGDEVRPFKTGAFQAVAGHETAAVLPFYLKIVEVEGQPAIPERRRTVTWADDTQTFFEHSWFLLGLKSVHFRVIMGEPVPTNARDRKELARLTHTHVSTLGGHLTDEGS